MSPWIPFNLLPADTLPEWILVALAGLDLLLFGLVLVAVIAFAPGGVVGLLRRRERA